MTKRRPVSLNEHGRAKSHKDKEASDVSQGIVRTSPATKELRGREVVDLTSPKATAKRDPKPQASKEPDIVDNPTKISGKDATRIAEGQGLDQIITEQALLYRNLLNQARKATEDAERRCTQLLKELNALRELKVEADMLSEKYAAENTELHAKVKQQVDYMRQLEQALKVPRSEGRLSQTLAEVQENKPYRPGNKLETVVAQLKEEAARRMEELELKFTNILNDSGSDLQSSLQEDEAKV